MRPAPSPAGQTPPRRPPHPLIPGFPRERRASRTVPLRMKPKASDLSDDIGSKIILQGIHLELTPSLQEAIRDKLAVLLRHNPFIIRIDVRLHSNQTLGQNHRYRASAQIEIGGPDLHASAEGPVAYDVIDELVGKLTTLLERRHGLRKDRRNHPKETEFPVPIPKSTPEHDARVV